MFRKRLTEIEPADLEALIKQGAQEDRTLEFKETLPGRDGNPDPWISSQSKIGNIAKRDLAKELIAFANTSGGMLILGMKEDGERRASQIVTLPECRELADRLASSISASIDPPLHSLEAVGVETDGRSGVVVFRVPLSHFAPHRDKDERECYHRVGDKSVPMTMRQIQDSSINTDRRIESIGRALGKLSESFEVTRPRGEYVLVEGVGNVPLVLCGMRAAAIPLQSISIEGINTRKDLHMAMPSLRRRGSEQSAGAQISLNEYPRWQPMLRGIRSIEVPQPHEIYRQIVRSNGLLEIARTAQQTVRPNLGVAGLALHVKEIQFVFAHLIIRVEMLRNLIGRPDLEFALDFEWVFPDGAKALFPSVDGYASIKVGRPIEVRNRVADYEMPSRDRIIELWQQIEKDIMHSFGFDDVVPLDLDFEAAITEGLLRAKAMH